MAALSESHLRTIYNANEGIDGIHSLIVCNAIVIFAFQQVAVISSPSECD